MIKFHKYSKGGENMTKEDLNQIAIIVKTEVGGLRDEMNQRFKEQDEKIEQRFKEQDEKIEQRIKEQDEKIEQRFKKQDEKIEQRLKEQDEKFAQKFKEQEKRIDKRFYSQLLHFYFISRQTEWLQVWSSK